MYQAKTIRFPLRGALPGRGNGAARAAAAGFLVTVAWMIVLGWGLYVIAAGLVAAIYLLILARWQRGLYALLVYLPFSGVAALALYPWNGPAALNPILYKDWLFLLPVYAGFLVLWTLRREAWPSVGRFPSALFLGLTLLVLAQMANPSVPSFMVALIGAKVWLFYLPLYVLGAALINTRRDLILLLRILVVLAVFPCLLGIAEYLLAQVLGYREVMQGIYGGAAQTATQEFTVREIGAGWIERIPSTFTFPTQYFSFILAMIGPCYALRRIDHSARWRAFGQCMLVATILAGLLCGTRAAFVFMPFLLALIYGIDRGFAGLVRVGVCGLAAVTAAMAISRNTTEALYEHVSSLFGLYAEGTAYGGLVQAVTSTWLGSGTGTNTGPARYAFSRPEFFSPIENYYAKAAYELGIAGLLLVWVLFAALIWQGWKAQRRVVNPGLRSCGAAFVAFLIALALYCFKGWVLDLDPINVYFWLFAGVAAKLPSLEMRELALTRQEPALLATTGCQIPSSTPCASTAWLNRHVSGNPQ